MTRVPSPLETLAVYGCIVAYVVFATLFLPLHQARWLNLLFPAGLAVIPVLFAFLRHMYLPSVFPVVRVSLSATVGALLLVPIILIVLMPLANVVAPYLPVDETAGSSAIEALLSGGFVYAFLFIVILPAFSEEILFRGFILAGLRNCLSKWPAILLCTVLFAALHMEPMRIPFTLLPGLAITMVAWHTRSLVLPVLMHLLHNGILFYILWTGTVIP